MDKKYEFKASTVDAAIDAGLKELNLSREDAEIEIISNGGFLKKATVAISKKEKTEPETINIAVEQKSSPRKKRGQRSKGFRKNRTGVYEYKLHR
jgi:predicted RNA-binding protein Jag